MLNLTAHGGRQLLLNGSELVEWINCQEKQKQTLGERFASPNLGTTGSSFTLGALLFSPRKDNFPQGDLLNEAVYFHPCDDGRESGSTIKEE